jgi:DNA-binding protein H-NS
MATKKRTYSDVKAQIETLQLEAEKLRAAELKKVLAEVRAKVAEYALTERDVFGGRRTARGLRVSPKPAAAARYRDPKSGATWTGRGRAPAWIAGAKDRTRFLIEQ